MFIYGSLFDSTQFVCMYVCMYVCIWEKYGGFINSFRSYVKLLIQRHEHINYKIGSSKVSILFN